MADGTFGLEQLALGYVTVLGACLGSFVNVLIARLPEDRSVVRPASACPRCHEPIAWFDNIPIFSFLWLRGRCRHCKASIAVRYVVVEVLMAALAAALFVRFGLSWDLLIWLPMAAALIAITYLDIDHWWVPDVITYPAMVLVALASFLPGGVAPTDALLGLIPAAFVLAVAWTFERVTQRPGLGLGDVKLLALLGLALGPMRALTVLLLAAVQGSVIGSIVLLAGGHRALGEPDAPDGNPGEAERAQVEDSRSSSAVPRPPNGTQTPDGPSDASPATLGQTGSPQDTDGSCADEDDDWVPPARAIPFGPFLVLAALEVVLLPQVLDNLPQHLADMVARFLG